MAKIQDWTAIGRPNRTSPMTLTQIDAGAMGAPGRAQQQLGQSIAQAGKAIGAAIGSFQEGQDKSAKFQNEIALQEFALKQDDAYNAALRDIPEDGKGFRSGVSTAYFNNAREFMKTVPDDLKPETDLRLHSMHMDLERRSRDAEYKQQDNYNVKVLDGALEKYHSDTEANLDDPNRLYTNIQRGIEAIDASTLPENRKAALRQQYGAQSEERYIEAKRSEIMGRIGTDTPENIEKSWRELNEMLRNRQYPAQQGPGGTKLPFGVEQRSQLYPGEDKYFKDNPNVAGMAAEDGKVILNPYSTLSPDEKAAVARNEAARVFMRGKEGDRPSFDLTPEQKELFKGTPYENDEQAMRETVAARLFSGDPSAGNVTDDQKAYVDKLKSSAGTVGPQSNAAPGSAGEYLQSRLAKGYEKRTSDVSELQPVMQDRLAGFIQAAEEAGHDISVLSGHRSNERQQVLWEGALKKYGSAAEARRHVAPPGGSSHNVGLAVDLQFGDRAPGLGGKMTPAVKWAHDHAAEYGLHFRLNHEDWHIEPVEVKHGARYASTLKFDQSSKFYKPGAAVANADVGGGGGSNEAVGGVDEGWRKGRNPDTLAAVDLVANSIKADPSAIGAVFTVESGKNWNPKERAPGSQYVGVSQIGEDTLREMGVSPRTYANMSQSEQAAFYGKWLQHYKFTDKMKAAGIEFELLPPARQAAILQAFQFSPNGSWLQRLGKGDTDTPVTRSKQARVLGSTSIADMEAHFSKEGVATQGGRAMALGGPKDDAIKGDPESGPRVASYLKGKFEGQTADASGRTVPQMPGYGGNIDLDKRPTVPQDDGTFATIKSMSFNEDGKEILIPTISPDGRQLSNEEAIALYHETGKHLGKFDTPEQATAFAKTLSERQGTVYAHDGKTPVADLSGGQIGTILDGIPDEMPLSQVPAAKREQVMAMFPREAIKPHTMPDGSKVMALDMMSVGEVKEAIASQLRDTKRALDETGVDRRQTPRFNYIDENTRRRLLNKLQIDQRNFYQNQQKAEIDWIKKTGEPRTNSQGRTLIDWARNVYTPNQLQKLDFEMKAARWHYDYISNMNDIPTDELDGRIAELEQTSGDSLEVAQMKTAVRNDAIREADKIRKLRETDFAKAVEKSPEYAEAFYKNQTATKNFMIGSNGGKPNITAETVRDGWETIIEGRISAQERLSGERYTNRKDVESPIRLLTNDEARYLLGLAQTKRSWGSLSEEEQMAHLKRAATIADQTYGRFGRAAFDEAVAVVIKNGGSKSAEMASGIAQKMIRGEKVTQQDMSKYQAFQAMTPVNSFLRKPTPESGWSNPATIDGRQITGGAATGPDGMPGIMQGMVQPPNQGQVKSGAAVSPSENLGKVIQWFMADPQNRAEALDRRFGAGTAAEMMKQMEQQKQQGNKSSSWWPF